MFDKSEYQNRLTNLKTRLEKHSLDIVAIFDSVNLSYYTATIQNGVFIVDLKTNKAEKFFIRRNYERAKLETVIENLYEMRSFKVVAKELNADGIKSKRIGIAKASLPMSLFEIFAKNFPADTEFVDISQDLAYVRAIKSNAELDILRLAGKRQAHIFDSLPSLIEPGITEWWLGTMIRSGMMSAGDAGISRLSSFGSVLGSGNVSFGDSGNYPTTFDGPGGVKGLSAAMPVTGSDRKLVKNEPVYVDFVFSHLGYFVDRTRVFAIDGLSKELETAHKNSIEIQNKIVSKMVVGAIPSKIYAEVNEWVDKNGMQEGLMGFASNKVGFFAHGIGLVVDEFPVIAPRFDEPLIEGMVLAVEPKIAVENQGLVGIENTWVITDKEPEKLTIGSDEIVYL